MSSVHVFGFGANIERSCPGALKLDSQNSYLVRATRLTSSGASVHAAIPVVICLVVAAFIGLMLVQG